MTPIGVINFILTVLTFVIFARVILSWVAPMLGPRPNPTIVSVISLVTQVTEPVLRPLRQVLPRFGNVDLSPMAALLILWIIRIVVGRLA